MARVTVAITVVVTYTTLLCVTCLFVAFAVIVTGPLPPSQAVTTGGVTWTVVCLYSEMGKLPC